MYQQQKQQPIGNELPYAPIASHSNNGHFCFTVVEHQRWYPFKGWSSNLLSKDRPEWSDIYHQPVPSIDSFKLPEPIAHTKNNTQISWKWITESWQAPTGWEYGSYDWQSWSKQHALHKLTRRRHWVRTASFSEEQRAVTAAIPMSRSNSLSTMTTSSSLSSESSLSSIDLIPSLSCHVQTKSIPTCMVFGKHHSEMLFTADAL
ncbi:hypothetical protein K501DRAFT_177371 [Backusella circina FSU 941]|nr:hypothetical protein K501DRAFT_177371 [Backusella circina FSU 941]